MDWGQPHNFICFWVLPLAAALFLIAGWRKKALMRRLGDESLILRLMPTFAAGRRWVKRALFLSALALVVAALAQPHFRKKETLVEKTGIDIMIAVDVSNSMLAKDIAPSRLEKAKLELSGLIDKLKGDRIGIVAFAGEAFIQCPLTIDRGAVKLFLSTVSPNLVTLQGTSLSSAIRTAAQAFPVSEKGHKAVILLTDGEDLEGEAVEAAKKAHEEGVRIFPIGIGTPEGRTIPDESGQGIKRDRQGNPVISKLNEDLLKEIARVSDGTYFRSSRGELETDALAREIGKISQKDMGKELSIEYEENYQWFLALAFFVLLLELALSERKKAA